jgi:hypothetical protein
MNAKWKIGIHIAVTLVIGIAIGVLLNRALVGRWIRETLTMREVGLRAPGPQKALRPLAPEQEAKIQPILDQHAKRMSEIHARYRKEIEAAFKSLKDEIDPILTPEQKAQFEKFIPGPPPPMPGQRDGFPGGRGPGDLPLGRGPFSGPFELSLLKTKLNLSEDQAAKIKAIQDDFDKKTQWTPDSRFPPFGLEALRKAEQDRDEEILKILSGEQKEKYRRLRGPGFGRPGGPYPLP